jgi:hypothetical protein
MTHLTTKIMGAVPLKDGSSPSKNIQQIQGYPAGVTADQTLVFDETAQQWVGGTLVAGADPYPLASFGRGEAEDYANCGVSLSTGNVFCLYDTDPINNISDSVSFNYIAGSWLGSVTLQAGKYDIATSLGCVFTSTGALRYHWVDESDERVSSQGTIGELYGKSSYCFGYVDTASAITISLKIYSATNVSSAQGTFPSTRSFLTIRKVL